MRKIREGVYSGNPILEIAEKARQSGDWRLKFSPRYNGGWVKTIEGIDKTKNNGFSLIGKFLDPVDFYNVGGLYLDCDVQGSRKHQEKNYRLFTINEDGEIVILQEIVDGKQGWAIELWDTIEKFLNK
jgi:hypothetical protein